MVYLAISSLMLTNTESHSHLGNSSYFPHVHHSLHHPLANLFPPDHVLTLLEVDWPVPVL